MSDGGNCAESSHGFHSELALGVKRWGSFTFTLPVWRFKIRDGGMCRHWQSGIGREENEQMVGQRGGKFGSIASAGAHDFPFNGKGIGQASDELVGETCRHQIPD